MLASLNLVTILYTDSVHLSRGFAKIFEKILKNYGNGGEVPLIYTGFHGTMEVEEFVKKDRG